MTPDQRIRDCFRIGYEIACGPERPWYCSSARLRHWDQNHISGNFTYCVNLARRHGFGDDTGVWREVADELSEWNPQNIVN